MKKILLALAITTISSSLIIGNVDDTAINTVETNGNDRILDDVTKLEKDLMDIQENEKKLEELRKKTEADAEQLINDINEAKENNADSE